MTARMLYGFSCLLLLCGCETMNTYRSLGWEPGYDWDLGASAQERNVAMTEEFAAAKRIIDVIEIGTRAVRIIIAEIGIKTEIQS